MQSKISSFINNNKTVIISLLVATVLSYFSCFIIFKQEYDVSIYKQMINTMQTLNISDLLKYIFYRLEILSMSYFYIMGKLNLENYIQVLPTFIFYFNIFYIILDYSKLKKYNYKIPLLISILFMALFKYINIVACIRNNLAFSIFLMGLYFEVVKKKKNIYVWILYISSCFIHTFLILVLLIKILLQRKNKKNVVFVIILIVVLILFPSLVVNALNLTNIQFFNVISDKIELYILNSESFFSIQYLFRIMQFIALSTFSIYYIIRYEKDINTYNRFYIIIAILTWCLMSKYWIFLRLVDFMLFLSCIPIMKLLNVENSKIIKFVIYLGVFLMIIVGIRIQIPTFPKMFIR